VVTVSLVGGVSFTGLAMLLAARARSAEVVSGLMNLVMLPMYLLSGAFFSAQRFPAWMQPLIQPLPLTAMNDALRAVINEGASLASQGSELAILAAWGVIPFVLALRLFRWQ
jgi:ABC-type multidrug transport system permease subunit